MSARARWPVAALPWVALPAAALLSVAFLAVAFLAVALLAVALLAAAPAGVSAQAATTVPPTDALYGDLERMEAFGLVPRGVSGQRPLSVARLTWLAGEARAWLHERGPAFDPPVRADLDALLTRVERRLGLDPGASAAGRTASMTVEAETGGGRSPGRRFPDAERDGIGLVDAVSNPPWANRGGRSYGDQFTAALAARVDLSAGQALGISAGARAAQLQASGAVGGRGKRTVETLSARAVVGSMALDVGRSAVVWGRTGVSPLLLSPNGVPLDLVRLSTDRPLSLGIFGDVDLTAFVADLGAGQHFPHTKEIGLRMDVRPVPSLTVGLAALNKQGGEGAPVATLGQRLWDASVIGPALFGDSGTRFSDKLLALDLRWSLASLRGLEVTAAGLLTDFEKARIGDVLDYAGGYRLGLALPRLGASQRHSLAVEGQRFGPTVYRHFQFRSGLATEHMLQGSPLGPDARAAMVRYAYDRPFAAFRVEVEGTVEGRSADLYGNRYDPYRDVYKVEDLPDEVRRRLRLTLTRWFGPGHLQLMGAVERVRDPDYPEAGPARNNVAVLLRFVRVF